MKQAILLALGLVVANATLPVPNECLIRSKQVGSVGGTKWDDMSLLENGRLNTDNRLYKYEKCERGDNLSAMRFELFDRKDKSANPESIKLTTVSNIKFGDCTKDPVKFEFYNFEKIDVYTKGGYITGMKMYQRDGTQDDFVEIGNTLDTSAYEKNTITIPKYNPVVGTSGTFRAPGLTSMQFIFLDLKCAGAVEEPKPEPTPTPEPAKPTTTTTTTTDSKSTKTDKKEFDMMYAYIAIALGIPLICILCIICCIIRKKNREKATWTASSQTL